MAKRRMFSLDVVDTDEFLDLPGSSQALYFHLGMRADDDGFVSSPKRITSMVGVTTEDFATLVKRGFVIQFESGVCAIRHWKVNNYLRGDRYSETRYLEEKALLEEKNRVYLMIPKQPFDGIPSGNQAGDDLETQNRLGKNSLEKNRQQGTEIDESPSVVFSGKYTRRQKLIQNIYEVWQDVSVSYTVMEVQTILEHFFQKYRDYTKDEHPMLWGQLLIDTIKDIESFCDSDGVYGEFCPEADEYIDMIDDYFEIFPSLNAENPTIFHFLSGNIRYLRYMEIKRGA